MVRALTPVRAVRGQGANHALQDGLHLARAINTGISMSEGLRLGRKWDATVTLKRYEEEMIARTEPVVLGSRAQGLDTSLPSADSFLLKQFGEISSTVRV